MKLLSRLFLTIAIFVLFIVAASTSASPVQLANNTTTSVENLLSSQTAVQFTLHTPIATIDSQNIPHIAGLDDFIRDAGAPALPVYSTLVALPPEATVSVSVESIKSNSTSAAHIAPAEAPRLANISEAAVNVAISAVPITNEPNPAIYNSDSFYPQALYTVSEPMYYRDVRFVRLQLYPLRYNAVTQQLEQATQLQVSLRFAGERPFAAPEHGIVPLGALETAVINPEYLDQWRHLLDAVTSAPETTIPTDRDTYKIEIIEDGIYEISYETLQAANMDVANVNPNTFMLLHRGQPVAYQFIGNSNNQFESGEAIRFYGWAFDGPRAEQLYIDTNVFWLWANDTPSLIGNKDNEANQPGYVATDQFRSSQSYDEALYYFSAWDTDWEASPNDPDSFFTDYIGHTTESITKTYTVALSEPVLTGEDATYTIEINTRQRRTQSRSYQIRSQINDEATFAEATGVGTDNFNLVETIPAASIVAGDNTFLLDFQTDNSGGETAEYYLNRITVDYSRRLVAADDTLIFGDHQGGQKTFLVDGFSETNALVWDVSNPYQPQEITMAAEHVVPNSDGFRYLVGSEHGENGRFIATTYSNIKSVTLDASEPRLSLYRPVDLTPPNAQADWLVITHGNFSAAANKLATHRALPQYGGHRVHQVTIEDVVNQYGYGLHHPQAIRDFLTHTLANWNIAPRYILLVGDGSMNPLQHACIGTGTCAGWSQEDETFIVTGLPFVDRFQGQIVSDHPLVLLSGDDVVADMAIGRISANTLAEANAAVDKIIWFEEQQLAGAEWTTTNMFVADDDDPGAGFFCSENVATSLHVPEAFRQIHVCFDQTEIVNFKPTEDQTAALRAEMATYVNGDGVGIMNYRGHGGRNTWASPAILSTSDDLLNFWSNFGKPPVILSADCWDGHFGWPGVPSLSETWLRMNDLRGVAAHWSSSGLGFSFEHTILHQAFYDGLETSPRIGDAILFAKLHFTSLNQHESEVYSFILQGDPAMRIHSPIFTQSLPIILKG